MAAVLALTSVETFRALALPLLFAGTTAIAYGAVFTLRAAQDTVEGGEDRGRAFSFRTALLFALSITAIMFASAAIVAWMGAPGLIPAAAVTGFADAHATAVSAGSLVGSKTISATQATVPILLGLTTNTVTKIIVAMINGGRHYAAQVIPGLILTITAAWLGWALSG